MFRLQLTKQNKAQWAIYDPFVGTLKWEDTGQDLIQESCFDEFKTVASDEIEFHPTSRTRPATKQKNPDLIKIQLGFACNYSCSYCSQNNLRSKEDSIRINSSDKVDQFLKKLPDWYSGGPEGNGQGTRVEFWGGETLLYWPAVKELTIFFRTRFPKIQLVVYTNGSLTRQEMWEFAKENLLHFSISHDGPEFVQKRNKKDPLSPEGNQKNLRNLFSTLSPLGLVSFNAALTPNNYSLLEIRRYIAEMLAVPEREVMMSFDIVTPYDQETKQQVISPEEFNLFVNRLFNDLATLPVLDFKLGRVDQIVMAFLRNTKGTKVTPPQRCKMDKSSSLAVDLDGNVLTCQNVTATSGHRIGHVENFADIRLNTATHWRHRQECVKCPVVQLCRGSCMFLDGDLWTTACDQFFAFHLAFLAYALFLATDSYLTTIEGTDIRGHQGINQMKVLSIPARLPSNDHQGTSL